MFVRHLNKVVNLAQCSSFEPAVADPSRQGDADRIYIRFPYTTANVSGDSFEVWDDLVFQSAEDMWRAFEMICDKLAKNAYYVNLNKQNRE